MYERIRRDAGQGGNTIEKREETVSAAMMAMVTVTTVVPALHILVRPHAARSHEQDQRGHETETHASTPSKSEANATARRTPRFPGGVSEGVSSAPHSMP